MRALPRKLFLSISLMLSLLNPLLAIDRQSLETLKKQGYQIRMGELTGAGSKMSLSHLAGFIHPNGVIMKEEISNIIFAPSTSPNISDIKKIQVGNDLIEAKDLEGFFVRLE